MTTNSSAPATPSAASMLSGSTAITSTEIHRLPFEAKYIVKQHIRGLAKRMIHRLLKYQILDGFSDVEIWTILDAVSFFFIK